MADNQTLDQSPEGDLDGAGRRAGSKGLGRSERPTIGLLLDNALHALAWDVWAGADDATKRRDANLLCIVGGTLPADAESVDPANVVYDLVGEDTLDGLVIWAGGLGQGLAPEDVKAFCERYEPLPMVSAALPLEGMPSVVMDNYGAMRQVLAHLVEEHGHRRIAFVRGPEGHVEADERYRAYVDVLAESGLVHDPALVVPGHFQSNSGAEAVQVLLDERGLTQGSDFEVLVAFNDATAIQAVEAFQDRGVRVPREVAVVGFDNASSGAAISPPLTTVPSLVYEQARRATEMALALVQGKTVPERVMLPAELIVRQSCGCLDPAIAQAEVEGPQGDLATGDGDAFETVLTVRRSRILSEVMDAAGPSIKALDPRWAEHLLAVFAVEVGGEAPGAFLSTLERTLGRVVRGGGDVTAWQNVISSLRQNVRPALVQDAAALARAENLWQQARVMVAGAAERAVAYRALQKGRRAELLREMDRSLMTAADREALAEVLAQRLPGLGAASCTLASFADPAKPVGWANLILAYGPGGRVELEASKRRFPSRELAPGGLLWRDRRSSLVLDPLVFQDQRLGFVVLEMGPAQAEVHAALPGQLGGALYRMSLLRQEAGHAVQLQTGAEVARVAGGILELEELMGQAVDLIRERFGLYYVGLFLVDEAAEWTGEAGRWAVLRAGTGEAGQAMVEAGHKLEVGSESMIGWCTERAQARIALDVGGEAVRFDNPLLPLTRSEMALPFVSRGRVIGAMSIQSERPAAFSQDDVISLQTMADQLANAIENARLFEGRERRITELSIVNEIGAALGTTMGLDELLGNVHRQVSRLFDTTSFYIATYEHGSDEWYLAYRIEEGERVEPTWHSIEAGLTGYMIRNRQSLLFHRTQDLIDLHIKEGIESVGVDAKSWLGVPLIAADKVVGVMAIQDYGQERLYDDQDLALFSTVAAQVATALDNLGLVGRLRERADEMGGLHEASQEVAERRALLNELSQELSHATSRQEILDIAAAKAGQIFAAGRASVAMLTGEGKQFEVYALHGAEGAVPVGEQVLATDRPIGTAVREERLIIVPDDQSADLGGVRSSMVAPLMSGRGPIGTLNVGHEQPNAYDQGDGALLVQVASLLSSALENRRLIEETEQRLQELTMLSDVSQSLAGASLRSEEVAEILARQFVEMLGVPEASVSLLDPDGETLHVLVDLYVGDEGVAPDLSQESYRLSDYPATARVMQNQEPLIVHASDADADPAELAYMREQGMKTLVIIPLAVKGQAIGVVELEAPGEEQHYTEAQLNLAHTMANQAAVGLENARLFEDTQVSAQDQATLRRVTEAVSRSLEMEALLATALDTVLASLGFDSALVSLTEEDSDQLVLVAEQGLPEAMARTLRQEGLADTLCDVVFQTGETVAIGDVRLGAPVNVDGVIRQGLFTYAGVPLVYQERRIGTICAFGREPRDFTSRELTLLEGVGAQLGVGVANARLFAEIQTRLQELEVINEIGQAITSVLDVDELLRQVVDITRTRFGYYHAAIMLVEGGELVFRDGSTIGDSDLRFAPGEVTIDLASQQSLNAEAVRTGRPVLVNDALQDPRFLPVAELPDTRAELDVPIEVKGQVIGVLGVQSERPFAFDRSDVALLQSLALQVGIAIDNARLFGQEQRALDEAQNATLQLGQRVQELNILNDIGRKIDEGPAIPEFLDWVTGRIPLAMQQPDKCVAAVEYDDEVYGTVAAVSLPHQIVQGLYASGERVGRLYIAYTEQTDFVNVESALMGDISRRVSGYLENRQLLDETQRRVREMQMLYEVGATSATGVRLDETLQAAVEAVAAGMRYPIVGVELVDRDSRTLSIAASVGYPPSALTDAALPLGAGITGWVAQEGEPLLVADVRQDPRYVQTVSQTRSEMCVPLFVASQVIGVLNVESPRPGAFSEGDLRLLSTVAASLGALAERVRLFEEARGRADELAVLNELSHALTARLSVEDVLEETYRQTSRLLDTTNFYIGLYDEARDEIRFIVDYAEGIEEPEPPVIPASQGMAGRIINTRQPILIEENVVQAQEGMGIEQIGKPSLSFLGVPLLIGEQAVGAMAVQSYTTPGLYGEHERDLLTAIAGSVAVAFQNARLFSETEESLAETETLYEASRLLASAGDLQGVVAAVAEGMHVPAVNRAVLWGLERDAGGEVEAFTVWANWHSGQGTAPLPLGARFPLAQFPATSLVLAQDPLFVDNIPQDPRLDEITRQAFAQQNAAAMAVLPLWLGGSQTGLLMLVAEQAYHFTAEEVRPYRSLAGQVAIAVENRRLFEQTQRQLADLDTIQMTMSQLTAALTSDEAIDALLPQVAGIALAETVVMYAVDGTYMIRSGIYSTVEREDLVVGEIELLDDHPLTKQALETRQPLVLLADDERLPPQTLDAYEQSGVAASATIPLVGREDVVGFLALHRYRPEPGSTGPLGSSAAPGAELKFTEQEINLVETLADQATIAIEKSRLLEEVQRRTLQLQTAAQVSQAASSILSVQELVEESVRLIRDRYDFYYVGLFLLDEDGAYAVLRAGTGDAGQVMVERKHRLRAGGESMIGQCVSAKQARIAVDVGDEAARFDNPLLPETRSEMALPLVSRGQVQGALTVQSTQAAAFSEEDVTILQSMANQLANAIANAGLYAQAQGAAQQAQALYETSSALYQASRAITVAQSIDEVLATVLDYSRSLDLDRCLVALLDEPDAAPADRQVEVRAVWDAQNQEALYLGNRFTAQQLPFVAELGPSDRLVNEDLLSLEPQDGRPGAALQQFDVGAAAIVPLSVGGRILGWLLAETIGRARTFPELEVDALQSLAGQAAVAIQGVRQLQAIEARAQREQLLREITTQVRGSTDPDAIMRAAVRELGAALGRPAFVRLSAQGQKEKGGAQNDGPPPATEGGE